MNEMETRYLSKGNGNLKLIKLRCDFVKTASTGQSLVRSNNFDNCRLLLYPVIVSAVGPARFVGSLCSSPTPTVSSNSGVRSTDGGGAVVASAKTDVELAGRQAGCRPNQQASDLTEHGMRAVLPSAQSKQTGRQQGNISFAVVKWL